MSNITQERKSNLELLRILAMFGVIVLHYNSNGGVGGFTYAPEGSLNYYMLYFLEAIAISSVNLFVLITGYFMCESLKRDTIKPFKLLVQVILFREAGFVLAYMLGVLSTGRSFLSKDLVIGLLTSLVPNNYFVILYIALYMVSVYLNKVLKALDEGKLRQMLIILVVLFSVWTTLVDVLCATTGLEFIGLSTVGIDGAQKGYTVVNFLLMYCIGAYLRSISHKSYNTGKMVTLYLISLVLITVWSLPNFVFSDKLAPVAWEYCNPLVIGSAVLCFLIFKQLKIKQSKIINNIAKGSFTVYLAHTWFIPYIGVERFSNGNVLVQLLHVLLSCLLIYGVCWIMYCIYELITAPLFRWLEKKLHFHKIDLSE